MRSRLVGPLLAAAIAGAVGFLLGTVFAGGVSGAPAQASFRTESLGHLSRLDSVAELRQLVSLGSSTFHALDLDGAASRSINLSLGGDTVDVTDSSNA